MYPSTYETEAVIRLHQQDLLQAAERDRMLARRRTVGSPLHRALAGAGGWLVRVGSRLQERYTDAPAPGALVVARR